MATTIKFTKMQGTGNDYIYVNTLSSPLQDPIKPPENGALIIPVSVQTVWY